MALRNSLGEIYPQVGFTVEPEDEDLVSRRWKEYGFTELEI